MKTWDKREDNENDETMREPKMCKDKNKKNKNNATHKLKTLCLLFGPCEKGFLNTHVIADRTKRSSGTCFFTRFVQDPRITSGEKCQHHACQSQRSNHGAMSYQGNVLIIRTSLSSPSKLMSVASVASSILRCTGIWLNFRPLDSGVMHTFMHGQDSTFKFVCRSLARLLKQS